MAAKEKHCRFDLLHLVIAVKLTYVIYVEVVGVFELIFVVVFARTVT